MTTASIELFVSRLDDSVCDDWCWFLHWARTPEIYRVYTLHALNLKQKIYSKNLPFFLLLPSFFLSLLPSLSIQYACGCVYLNFEKHQLPLLWLQFCSLRFFSSNLGESRTFFSFSLFICRLFESDHTHTYTSAARCTNSISLLDFVSLFVSHQLLLLLVNVTFFSYSGFLVRQPRKRKNMLFLWMAKSNDIFFLFIIYHDYLAEFVHQW